MAELPAVGAGQRDRLAARHSTCWAFGETVVATGPDNASLTVALTLAFAAPRTKGGRAGQIGAAASRLIVTDLEVVPPALGAAGQGLADVSVLIVVGPQPDDVRIADWASVSSREPDIGAVPAVGAERSGDA